MCCFLFNFALSESFCLDKSSFCYLCLLTQVSGNGSPPLCHSGLLALSSSACCSPDAAFLVPFWLCHSWHRWGWWCGSGWLQQLPSGGQSVCWELVSCLTSVFRENSKEPLWWWWCVQRACRGRVCGLLKSLLEETHAARASKLMGFIGSQVGGWTSVLG